MKEITHTNGSTHPVRTPSPVQTYPTTASPDSKQKQITTPVKDNTSRKSITTPVQTPTVPQNLDWIHITPSVGPSAPTVYQDWKPKQLFLQSPIYAVFSPTSFGGHAFAHASTPSLMASLCSPQYELTYTSLPTSKSCLVAAYGCSPG